MKYLLTLLMGLVAILFVTAPAAAGPRPSCDAPLAQKLLAGGCNSVVGEEHEFTPMKDRNQPDYISSDEPSQDEPAETGSESENDPGSDLK